MSEVNIIGMANPPLINMVLYVLCLETTVAFVEMRFTNVRVKSQKTNEYHGMYF